MTDLLQPLIDRTAVIMMQQGLFTLDVPEALARKMTRAEYYRVRSWLRSVKRQMVFDALLSERGRLIDQPAQT